MAKVLMINPDKCTGCRNCELACSFAHEHQFRPGATRVHAFTWEREGVSVPMMCQQCDDAACVRVCPTGAMHRSATVANLVEWDAKACLRCKLCTVACPFGNARYDAAASSIFRCDTCGGDPECVKFCPNGALVFVDDEVQTRARKKGYAERLKQAFQEVR
jgi:anaerobic carbon-monoxide dehydrogenase iron sulfur subunit